MRFPAVPLVVLALAAPAAAQQELREETRIDVDRLPIDVGRIHRELEQARDEEVFEGLNLRYRIQVLGVAPPIRLFTGDDNLVTGPVPYGAPTHQEVIDHVTPLPFRTPIMDFSALIRWLADRDKDK